MQLWGWKSLSGNWWIRALTARASLSLRPRQKAKVMQTCFLVPCNWLSSSTQFQVFKLNVQRLSYSAMWQCPTKQVLLWLTSYFAISISKPKTKETWQNFNMRRKKRTTVLWHCALPRTSLSSACHLTMNQPASGWEVSPSGLYRLEKSFWKEYLLDIGLPHLGS